MTPRFISQKVSSDYVKLVITVVIIVFALSSFFIFTVKNNNKESIYASVEQRAMQLDASLSESLNYIIYLMDFLGKQISVNGPDLKYIASLYQGFSNDLKIKDLSSWSMFDWLTPDKNIRVTSLHGILKEPISLTDRKNLYAADKDPGNVYLNEPSMGKISKQLIIPVSKAVTDKDGNHLGFINIGVKVESMLSHLEYYNDSIRYAVFTDQFIQIATKSNNNFDKNLIEDLKNETTANKGLLNKPIILSNIEYIYYYKSPKYPFIFLLGYNREIQNHNLLNNLALPIGIFLILGLIAIILSYLLYSRVILPISDLGRQAKEIAEEKDVTIAINNKLPIEIVQLATQLNNINIYKKQLLNAKIALENVSAAKTEFLSSTAHELRSPLNAIIGMAEMIRRKIFIGNIDKYIEYAGDIEQSGHELLEFIDDLMDITKVEAGNFTLEDEEFIDIEKVIIRAIKLNISRANKANIQIHKSIEANLPEIYADGRRIRQALVNLLSNSIKYSPDNTRIDISAVMRDNKMQIIIADQGFGMDESQVAIALTKLGKVPNKNSGKVESHGLGLPLTKYLVELHNAELVIDSKPGKGTTITIVFPKDRIKYS